VHLPLAAPRPGPSRHLVTIPGVNTTAAQILIAEIGAVKAKGRCHFSLGYRAEVFSLTGRHRPAGLPRPLSSAAASWLLLLPCLRPRAAICCTLVCYLHPRAARRFRPGAPAGGLRASLSGHGCAFVCRRPA
jgi:hypothetical protein